MSLDLKALGRNLVLNDELSFQSRYPATMPSDFTVESTKQHFRSDVVFGRKCTVEINPNGYLCMPMYLEIVLPPKEWQPPTLMAAAAREIARTFFSRRDLELWAECLPSEELRKAVRKYGQSLPHDNFCHSPLADHPLYDLDRDSTLGEFFDSVT
jgi:hypothetical protein